MTRDRSSRSWRSSFKRVVEGSHADFNRSEWYTKGGSRNRRDGRDAEKEGLSKRIERDATPLELRTAEQGRHRREMEVSVESLRNPRVNFSSR